MRHLLFIKQALKVDFCRDFVENLGKSGDSL